MLVISGVMIGYICSAITDFVVTFADDSNIVNLHNWSLGSFSGMTWGNVRTMAVVVLLTMVIVFFMSKPISAYSWARLTHRIWESIQSVPDPSDPAFQYSFRLCDRICRPDLLCGNRRAPYCKKSLKDCKAAACDPGLFPGRCGVLPVL